MAIAMSKFLDLSNPYKRYAITLGAALSIIYSVGFTHHGKSYYKKGSSVTSDASKKASANTSKETAQVDKKFLMRMSRILKILIPKWASKEVWYIVLVAVMLSLRTRLDVWMIDNGTAIEGAIIDRDRARFLYHLFQFCMQQPILALNNQLMKYGLNSLKLQFRERFSLHLYEEYLKGHTYYKMSNVDNRISNADQLLTQDVEKCCNSIVDLYSNLSKPMLELVIYIYQLTGTIGFQGPSKMIGYLLISGMFLTILRKPIGKLTVGEQKLEGEYRYVNSRLITNSEEVAFYNGNNKEKHTIVNTFNKLMSHLKYYTKFRFRMGVIDDVIAKYFATTVGYLVVSRPFFNKDKFQNTSHNERLQSYYRSGRMLVRLAQAIGRIALSGREMSRLAGFSLRVTELMDVTDDLNKGIYRRAMVHQEDGNTDGDNQCKEKLAPGKGVLVIQNRLIKFDKVPLVTPNGDILINEMTFEVSSGTNVIVCGPNGCGKSSLFRTLGELWPLFGGTLTKPDRSKLFYIPQRPYMTLGTLRDQVIYPDSLEVMKQKGFNDENLVEFLKEVQLQNILEREGGWDSVQDWMDVLSGGEKQRIAMARLFYHKPQFAILDECTSAVSVDVEALMYQHCRDNEITLFTVSHRKSLWKHHEYYLYMDGRGSYEFKTIADGMEEPFGS